MITDIHPSPLEYLELIGAIFIFGMALVVFAHYILNLMKNKECEEDE